MINEKALSKKQQRFFGIVRATQKGTFKGETTPQVQRAASSMKKKDVKKFASTKHKGLPEKKMAKEGTCGKGEYYCHDRKKCMPIPKGAKVGKDGMLVKEKLNIGEGSLHKWFKGSKSKDGKGGWVNVVTGGTCASDEPGEGTPKCVSSSKRASMSKAERLSAARRKKKADPGQQTKSGAAKPTYVSTDKPKKKMKESIETDSSKKRAQAILDAKRKREEDRMLAKKEEVQTEAKIDKIDPKSKRKRRNEVTFGKQTKPYDPPGKAYKNEMGKFLQKQRKERHDKMRGVKTKLKEYSLHENPNTNLFGPKTTERIINTIGKTQDVYNKLTTNQKTGKLNLGGKILKGIFGSRNSGSNYTKDGKVTADSYTPPGEVVFEKVYEEGIPTVTEALPLVPTLMKAGGIIAGHELLKIVDRKFKEKKLNNLKKEEIVLEADKKGKGSGSKDACYHKVKSRYSVWPSAYASGALVKCRKAGAANWGNSSKKEDYGMIDFQDFIYEKCWKGYEEKGMKTMFGKRYPNCVKKEEADLPVDECWKTHKKVGMKMKDGKLVNDCRPKNEQTSVTGDGSKLSPLHVPGGPNSQFNADGTPKTKIKINPKDFKLPGEKGRRNYLKSLNMGEAVETKKKEEKKPKKAMDAGARGRRLLQRKEYRAKVSEFIPKELEDQVQYEAKSPAWQRKAGKNPSGGLNAKGVASYRAANPGSKLKTAVTTKPSKLKKGSKAANRRKSFCARMKGMKKRLTSAKTARDPDSRINKSLRKWNC